MQEDERASPACGVCSFLPFPCWTASGCLVPMIYYGWKWDKIKTKGKEEFNSRKTNSVMLDDHFGNQSPILHISLRCCDPLLLSGQRTACSRQRRVSALHRYGKILCRRVLSWISLPQNTHSQTHTRAKRRACETATKAFRNP